MAQAFGTVRDGQFETERFTEGGGELAAGEYILGIDVTFDGDVGDKSEPIVDRRLPKQF